MIDLLFSVTADATIRITLLAAAIALVLTLFRIRSSSTRHTAWTAVLVVMLLLPALSRTVPSVPVPLPRPATIAMPFQPAEGIDSSAAAPRTKSHLAAAPADPTSPMSAANSAPDAETSPVSWQSLAVAVHAAGVGFFLMRLLVGLTHLWRIRRNSRPVVCPGTGELFESPFVATPVTIGLLNPRIVLPLAWREWPADMVGAVVAHERAHARRRDPLIALLARVNCTLYWFHPVAWWLERQLAITAEHACDDAAVEEVPRRRYAEALLEIATVARRHQGRLVWQGVGVDGDGRLGRRIDRVLSAKASPEPSRTRRALAATSCVLVIAAVIACRQAVEPLREDPQLVAELRQQKEQQEFYKAAERMTIDEAAALERVLEQNPEDMITREKLLIFYRWTGRNSQGWNDNVAARRRQALWLIQHHPDSRLMMSVRVSKREDSDGYAQARKLWLTTIAGRDIDPKILSSAARFFEESEMPIAEEILLRAKAQQPDGPQPRRANGTYDLPWSDRLGELYASAIMGRVGPYRDDPDATSKAWGRAKLEQSMDPRVLYSAGHQLSWAPQERPFQRQLMDRASQLGSAAAREWMRRAEPQNRLEESLTPNATGGERLRQLAARAEVDYMKAEYSDWRAGQAPGTPEYSGSPQRDKEHAAAAFARSKASAREAIDLGASLDAATQHPDLLFRAHIAYGLNVLREGDRDEAVRHLLEASKVSLPPQFNDQERFISGPSQLEYRLVNYLLKKGERQTVVEYLERSAPHRGEPRRAEMLKSAAAIREGRMPEHYQRLFAAGRL